jgi:MOSC domain-containing protein YiiM
MKRGDLPVATVTHIFVAPGKGAPAKSVASVDAMTEQGLRGDRYTLAKNRRGPAYQVTLIEIENIEGFTAATGLPFTPEMPRRNLITRGVRLNDLCGKRFRIGAAVFEGLELCEPCKLLAKRTHREVVKALAGKGGLRARILSGGEIRVGDRISATEIEEEIRDGR